MQTMRDIIKHTIKCTLLKVGNTDPFMEEVILTELMKNEEIRSIKSKTVAVIPKQKVIKPSIPTNITLLELKISQIFCEIHITCAVTFFRFY